MKFVDICAGIGGFRLGLERCGMECVYSVEIDKYAKQTYKKNFGHEHDWDDLFTLGSNRIPDADIWCAGFPCQSFSIAGKRLSFDDPRGGIIFKILQLISEKCKRPRMLFLENVMGLLSVDNGEALATILHGLEELGYWWEFEVLNSKNFGVPQNRRRVFIIGHLGNEGGREIFPIGQNDGMDKKAQSEKKQTVPCLEQTGYKGVSSERFYGIAVANAGLTTYGWMESDTMFPLGVDNPQHGVMVNLHQKRTGEYGDGIKQLNEPSFTLDGGSGRDLCIMNNTRIRRLTPTECERLQGFPDGWTEGVSDTQRYRQLGNAVTVNVIEAIGQKIVERHGE